MKRLIIIAAMFMSAPVLAESDPIAGKSQYGMCATCHGALANGNTSMNAPALAGLDADYIERQLKAYREGKRGSDAKDIFGQQMVPMAKILPNDKAVGDVAAYIASLNKPVVAKSAKGDPKAGQSAYSLCATCHGPKAEGLKAMNAPALIYLDAAYVERQLTYYKGGIRGAAQGDAFGAQMVPMAKTLADEKAVKDVVAYIESLRPVKE